MMTNPPENKPEPVQPEIILPSERKPEPRNIIPESPVHPLSSFVTIILDGVWSVLEIEATISIALLPMLLPMMLTSGVICALTVTMVQHFVAKDTWGASVAKGLVLGVAAGVPYPVTGTAIGGVLLGWSGLHELEDWIRRKRLPPGT